MKNIDPIEQHRKWGGKFEIKSRVDLAEDDILSIAYTPGVGAPCMAIHENPELVYELTRKKNTIAVISDGTAVLGLGDIGPAAAMPVMEGKAILFKEFGDVDAVPICLDTKDPGEIVNIIKAMAPSFGGINLEDISAPRCFEIERRLIEELDIPVFHDDQHGTAIVTLAGLINALRLTGKEMGNVRIVINGAGAAAIAITRLLKDAGAGEIILCDRQGAVYENRPENMNPEKERIAAITNPKHVTGTLADVIRDADVFIGVSAAGALTGEMIGHMAERPIVFACANPVPEIMPDDAKAAGVAVMATGRSDFPNQINNLLAFPGIFRGALDAGVINITTAMKLAAARAIADIIPADELRPDYIMPNALDKAVARNVAKEVERAHAEE
ncbi:MAG: NADP-dependent malic enzyme [Eubacteriales bacterium]|nr:NADP-dependent malic enzyme [Eubacteriales bacterium]